MGDTLGYKIIERRLIDAPNVYFIRIHPDDLQLTVRQIYISLLDRCWIKTFFTDGLIRASIEHRCDATIERICDEFNHGQDGKVNRRTGEYIVSEASRRILVDQLNYLDMPLHEFFKEKVVGNPGFDYTTVNTNGILLFAEAKYDARHTVSGRAIDQIGKFDDAKKWLDDYADIAPFLNEERDAKDNFRDGKLGFIAAFSSRNISSAEVEQMIKAEPYYSQLKNREELMCIAVDLWE